MVGGFMRTDDAEPVPMSPLTLPWRQSIFSLGGAKISKSTDALTSLDDPPSASVYVPSTPVTLTRRRGRRRPSLFSFFQRRTESPSSAVQPPGGPLTATRDRRPSACSADYDEEDDGIERGSGGAPPVLPPRPAHLLQLPSTPLSDVRPLPTFLPPIPKRQSSPLLHRLTVRSPMTRSSLFSTIMPGSGVSTGVWARGGHGPRIWVCPGCPTFHILGL